MGDERSEVRKRGFEMLIHILDSSIQVSFRSCHGYALRRGDSSTFAQARPEVRRGTIASSAARFAEASAVPIDLRKTGTFLIDPSRNCAFRRRSARSFCNALQRDLTEWERLQLSDRLVDKLKDRVVERDSGRPADLHHAFPDP
jgi:hypothetical protein